MIRSAEQSLWRHGLFLITILAPLAYLLSAQPIAHVLSALAVCAVAVFCYRLPVAADNAIRADVRH